MKISSSYLVADGFFRWEIERVDLWKLLPQVIVQRSEFSIAPVHIPLIIKDSNVHLKKIKKNKTHIDKYLKCQFSLVSLIIICIC